MGCKEIKMNVLQSVKEFLGIPKEVEAFDSSIMILISQTFDVLAQIGVDVKPYKDMEGLKTNDWDSYFNDDSLLSSIKTFVYLKVRVIFDPPANPSLLEEFNKAISETEWRIQVFSEREQ